MTDLVPPDVRLHESWAATVREFDGAHMDGSGTWMLPDDVEPTPEGCARLVRALQAADTPDPPRPGRVPDDGSWVRCTFRWVTDGAPGSGGGEVVGFLALRHGVPGWLFRDGGHIGYSVRPSRRREGHARRALGLALVAAHGLGLDPVLLCCRDDNEGSRRTILAHGGEPAQRLGNDLRFWVPTRPA